MEKEQICPVCKQPIKSTDPTFSDPTYGLVHEQCEEYIQQQKHILSESSGSESLDDVIKQTQVL